MRDICELQRGEWTTSGGMKADPSRLRIDWQVKNSRMRAAYVVFASISGALADVVVLLRMLM